MPHEELVQIETAGPVVQSQGLPKSVAREMWKLVLDKDEFQEDFFIISVSETGLIRGDETILAVDAESSLGHRPALVLKTGADQKELTVILTLEGGVELTCRTKLSLEGGLWTGSAFVKGSEESSPCSLEMLVGKA